MHQWCGIQGGKSALTSSSEKSQSSKIKLKYTKLNTHDDPDTPLCTIYFTGNFYNEYKVLRDYVEK